MHFALSEEAFERFKDKARELYTEPMEKTVKAILARVNYTDTFTKELRRRKRSINVYFK